MTAQNLKVRVVKEITKKTDRDKQYRVGPSELGNPCARCLGRALAGEREEQDFSLYPWIGTAGHEYLEHHTFEDEEHELRLFCGEVPGYGEIWGTTDMYLDGTIVDWKFVGIKKIREYRSKGARRQYRFQAMIYGKGCKLAGLPVDSVAICFIPRDSTNVNDIFIWEEAFQEEMADKALARAGEIYAHVLEHGWESLESDIDCWQCNNSWR